MFKFDDWAKFQTEALDSIAYCLEVSNELCRSEGVKFLAITHAGPLEICKDDPSTWSILKIEGHDYDVPILHLNSGISKAISGENCMDYGWPIDGHYTSKGYNVFSDVLWKQINSEYPDFFEIQTE